MKPSTGTKPHEGECDTMASTLDPDEKLQYHLDNIRRSLDANCDKPSTLDLKNFNLSELTATLFSTDSDMDLTLEDNTLDYKRSTLDSILCPQDEPVTTLSGVEIVMSDDATLDLRSQTYDLRSQTFDVINMMDDMPHDVMNDLDAYLDGACDSQYSTLDIPSTLSLAGSSQYSTLDTASSPHQRIVSQPIPSVDSLSQMVFEIPDQMISDNEDSLDRNRELGPELGPELVPDPNSASIRSITYVSSFSLDTMEKGEEVVEEVGDVMDDVIRSVAPASYEDCSLKLVQSPQSAIDLTKPASYPTLHGDEVKTLTPDIDPLISENLDTDTREKTIENGCCSPKEYVIKQLNIGAGVRNGTGHHNGLGAGVRLRACSVPNRPARPKSDLGELKRSSSESGDRHRVGSVSGHVHMRADSAPHRNNVNSDGTPLKRSCSESGGRNRPSSAADRKRPVSMFSDRRFGLTTQVSNTPSDQDVRDSGFDSLESSIASSRPAKPSRGVKKRERTEHSTMSSAGGTQCSGSGNSLEDVSCPSSPVMSDSSEISPPRHSTSVSSLPDLPHNMGRSRSAASNVSDHILTTLDRPRTQSFAGTPIRQAWLQVCCYERDSQTGNFLIDKHKVQIDGKFLHPELNNDPELYRISLTGLVNEERLPKTDKMLPEIGDGVIIARDRATGDVTLTKLCRKDVFMMNDNFLALKEDEKCKGRHEKLEQNTTYTIFNKQKFVEDVRNSAIDLTKIHTIGQVAIAFIKINGNSVKGVPVWIKVQCLEAMNLLKSLLAGSTSEEREWLRKPSMDCPESPRRASKARLSFGKSLSKGSLKDSKTSVNSSDSGNTPIPRTKSKSQLFRNKKKSSQQSNGASPEPRSNRNSGASQHLEPFALNYGSLDATEEPPPPAQALRDNELLRSRRISSPPNNLTSADVSLPLRRDSPNLPTT